MEDAARPLHALIALNTDLVLNCLDGISEADASARLTANTNSISFLLAHVADARFFLAKLLGRPLENPLEAALSGVTSIDEATRLPSMSELRGLWVAISGHVQQCVDEATADRWAGPSGSEYAFPLADATLLGAVAFLAVEAFPRVAGNSGLGSEDRLFEHFAAAAVRAPDDHIHASFALRCVRQSLEPTPQLIEGQEKRRIADRLRVHDSRYELRLKRRRRSCGGPL